MGKIDWFCWASGLALVLMGFILGYEVKALNTSHECLKQPTKIIYQYCEAQ